MQRREFLALGGAALAPFSSVLHAARDANKFYFAVIADTHIIDSFYTGPEGNTADTESIRKTSERLTAAREVLNALDPKMDRVFLVGDFFHDYPSPDIDFYFQNETRIDGAMALVKGFGMPVHVGFGNHDYGVPKVSREMSHELFRRKLNIPKPYYSVDHKGWKFVHLNNFLGETWNPSSAVFAKKTGSLGAEQLEWLEAELRQARPTFVFVHFPLPLLAADEGSGLGLVTLLRRHKDTLQRVVSGHWHRWHDFGREFGPEHLVIAATRYDPNAYLIVEADTKAGTHRLLNIDRVTWDTHYSQPFRF